MNTQVNIKRLESRIISAVGSELAIYLYLLLVFVLQCSFIAMYQ